MSNGSDLLKTYLLTLTSITDVAGSRIYTDEAPAQVRQACIVVQNIGGDNISDGLIIARPLIQISCYSHDKAESNKLASAVINSLGKYSGLMDDTYVVSTYQSDQIFRTNGWWHAPVDVLLKYEY